MTAGAKAPPGTALHFVTCEYPPAAGGVAAFTAAAARGLAAAGHRVHVWAPGNAGTETAHDVIVHHALGRFGRRDLQRASARIESEPGLRRIIVQWVPHGFGFRGMNLGIVRWLRALAAMQDVSVETVVHEPFLPFSGALTRQNATAIVQRAMLAGVLGASDAVWVSTESWTPRIRPWLRSGVSARAVPVPSGIAVHEHAGAAARMREQLGGAGSRLIGHLGTYGSHMMPLLTPPLRALLEADPGVAVALLGRGAMAARVQLLQGAPHIGMRVSALATQDDAEVSAALQACDVMVQPFPDGVSARRTSAIAAMAHGRAIVTTRGELTEPFWSTLRGVTLVAAGDAHAVVEATLSLLGDPSRRAQLGHDARVTYDARFDSRHLVAALAGMAPREA